MLRKPQGRGTTGVLRLRACSWNGRRDWFTVHIYFSGVTTYDGNGHATIKEGGTIFPSGTSFDTFEETANLTYQVRRNGNFTREGTLTAADGSYTVIGFKQVGQIDEDGSVLNLSGVIPPVLETLSSGGGSSARF